MDKQLKPEYQALADDFDLNYKDSGCSCHINPPCNHCIHPGHPENLEETPEAWGECIKIIISGRTMGRSRLIEASQNEQKNVRLAHYVKGETGSRFAGAHLRAKPTSKLKRSKKSGRIING